MEWTYKDTIQLLGFVLTVVSGIWYLSSRFTKLETSSANNGAEIAKVDKKLDQHIEAFDDHIIDPRVHTTEEQRKDISRRIDKLEDTFNTNFRDLGNKLDTWATRILSK